MRETHRLSVVAAAARAPDERSICENTWSARRRPRKWPRRLGESGKESPQVPAREIRARLPACHEAIKVKNGHVAEARAAEERS